MYNIIKNVLKTGNFELSDIKQKIDTFWLKGNITDYQRQELKKLAEDGAKAENSVDVLRKLAELEKTVADLEAKVAALENSGTESPEEPEEAVTYDEFVTGKWYYSGDKITFNGAVYECTAPEGTVCVWNPSDYPAYWSKIE